MKDKLCGISSIITIFCGAMSAASVPEWTWFHRKVFNHVDSGTHSSLHFSEINAQPFTQLLFSWNGFKPEKGYFQFSIQSRNSSTKKWGSWHKMIEWGADVQRSFYSKGSDGTHYAHVRLESGKNKASDGFRIRVDAYGGASVNLIKSCAVSCSDLRKFAPESYSKMHMNLPSVSLDQVPKKAQFALDHPRNNQLCSPTSCSMVTSFLTDTDIDAVEFANNAFDRGLDAYGSWPFNTVHAFEKTDGAVWFAPMRCHSFAQIHDQLKRGIPIIASVRGDLPGAPKPYNAGHLLVIVGWDQKKQSVICHDPAFSDPNQVVKPYKISHFMRAWERSRRLVYAADLSGLQKA